MIIEEQKNLLPTENIMTEARKTLLVNNLERMAAFTLRMLYLYGTEPPEPGKPQNQPAKRGGKAA
jgi:hypothetical protein